MYHLMLLTFTPRNVAKMWKYNMDTFVIKCVSFTLHTGSGVPPTLVGLTLRLGLEVAHVDAERVLLVAAQIGIAHKVQRVVVMARAGRHKVQLELGLLLQGEPLDRQQRVGCRIPDDDPPAFFAFLLEMKEKKNRKDRVLVWSKFPQDTQTISQDSKTIL